MLLVLRYTITTSFYCTTDLERRHYLHDMQKISETARKESLFFNIYILVITKPYLWNRNWKSVVNKWEFWHVQHQNYSSRGLPKQNHGKNKCFLLINLYRHAYCACYITKFVTEFHAHIFANRNITYILEVKVLVKVVFLNS